MIVLNIAVCVFIIASVNAIDDVIDMETILNLVKGRRSDKLDVDKTNDPSELIPIIPGFYLQKPEGLSQSLFTNPTSWSKAIDGGISDAGPSLNKSILRTSSREDYLKEKLIKSVRNLNKYRNSQRQRDKSLEDSVDDVTVKKFLGQMLNGIKTNNDTYNRARAHNLDSIADTDQKSQKALVEKFLTQILKEIKGNNRKRNKHKRQEEWQDGSKNIKRLKNFLTYLLKSNDYRDDKKYTSLSEESDTHAEYNRNLMENIFDEIKNKNLYRKRAELQYSSEALIEPPRMLRSGLLSRSIADFLYGRPHSKSFHNNEDSKLMRHKKKYKRTKESDDIMPPPLIDLTIRRTNKPAADKNKDQDKSMTTAEIESEDTDFEKNPGNPYTIHKNKYRQNWPFNHFMDGDHMNINPFAPQFGNLGPSGPELFFGRKWWYFNQDDYKPMG